MHHLDCSFAIAIVGSLVIIPEVIIIERQVAVIGLMAIIAVIRMAVAIVVIEGFELVCIQGRILVFHESCP